MSSGDFAADFVQLSLIDSAYAKVVFQDVRDVYPPNEDLECTYIVASCIEPIVGDTVRLFKVGWSSTDDYVAFVPCTLPLDVHANGRAEMDVTFKALALPEESSDFYQFCYITVDGEIRGASTPFLFKHASTDDLVTVNDIESDLLLIQTKTTLLEENLQKAMNEKRNAEEENRNLEKKLQDQKLLIESLENLVMEKAQTIKELCENVSATETSLAKNEADLQDAKEENEQLLNTLQSVQIENDSLKKTNVNQTEKMLQEQEKEAACHVAELASRDRTIDSLLLETSQLKSSVETVKKEMDELKEKEEGLNETQQVLREREILVACLLRQLASQDSTIDSLITETEQLRSSLQSCEKEGKGLKEKLQKVKEESDQQTQTMLQEHQTQVSRLTREVAAQDRTIDSLLLETKLLTSSCLMDKKEIKELRDKCEKEKNERPLMDDVSQQTKNMLDAMKMSKQLALKELEELKSDKSQLEISIELLQETNAAQLMKLDCLNEGLESKAAEIVGLKHENDVLKSNEKTMGEEITKLKSSVCDLKHRLKMGADEYKRKYVEWLKLKKRFDKFESRVKEKANARKDNSQTTTDENITLQGGNNGSANSDVASKWNNLSSLDSVNASNQGPFYVSKLSTEQKIALLTEMENQLLKFQTSQNSTHRSAEAETENASTPSTQDKDIPNPCPSVTYNYPYPPYYPYPYPYDQCQLHRQPSTPSSDAYKSNSYSTMCRTSHNYSCASSVCDVVKSTGTVLQGQVYDGQLTCTTDSDNPVDSTHNFQHFDTVDITSQGHDSLRHWIPCPLCDQQFSSETETSVIDLHIEEHFTMYCPICSTPFDRESQQEDFHDHITLHVGSAWSVLQNSVETPNDSTY